MKDCKLLEYAGYYGSAEVSVEDKCFCGSVQFIRDLISYSGNSFEELENSFHEAVDQYLVFCKETGQDPAITCSGTFNVRVGNDLHTQAVLSAKKSGMNLNEFVKSAIQEKVDDRKVEKHLHIHTAPVVSEKRVSYRPETSASPWGRTRCNVSFAGKRRRIGVQKGGKQYA